MSPVPDRMALARWLATHDGVISGNEAADLGLSAAMRRHLVVSGQWRRPHRGVFVANASGNGPRTALRVALALGGGEAVASHRSAAWLWGMIDQSPARPHISVPADRRVRVYDVVCHRTTNVLNRRQHAGFPLTDPAPTLIDLSASGANTTAAVERSLALHLVTVDGLARATRIGRDVHLIGKAALRRLLVGCGYVGAPHPSVLESRMGRLLKRMEVEDAVPYPETELAWDEGRYRLDFAWPAIKLAVEVDGYVWHAGAEQLDRDYVRRAELTTDGWTILAFTWRQVVDQPETVIEAVTCVHRRLNGHMIAV